MEDWQTQLYIHISGELVFKYRQFYSLEINSLALVLLHERESEKGMKRHIVTYSARRRL